MPAQRFPMQNGDSFYDIFFIYHPEDIEFTRRLADWLLSHNISCQLDENIGKPDADTHSLRDAILRSHTIALVLSPASAQSQLCNELVEYADANGKRFISLILNEEIAVGFHPAIAKNAYVFLRAQDDFETSASDLMQLLQVDAHLRLHTELLVSASKWKQQGRSSDTLLATERAETARQWLTAGANRIPKPSQLQVEFIHASRRHKPASARGFSSVAALGLFAAIILVAVIAIVQNAISSQGAATATAAFRAASVRQSSSTREAAASATAENDSAVRVLSNLAATSARIREEVLATVAAQAQSATRQAALTATIEAATALQAANARATERAQIQREVAAQAVIDGAQRALNEGDLELALALAWEAARTQEYPWRALRILQQALAGSPLAAIDDISLAKIHPAGEEIALVAASGKRILVYNTASGQLEYEIDDHDSAISAIAYAQDGQVFISAARDGTVFIRSSADGTPKHRLNAHEGPVRAIAAYRRDSKLVTASSDSLILWDLDTGAKLAQYKSESEAGLSIRELLVTAADERLIVWAGADAGSQVTMTQHSTATLELLVAEDAELVYLGYDREGGIAYSGGRSLPAYAGDPNTGDLRLWQTSSGQQLAQLSQGFNWSLISAGNIASATDSLQFISFGEDTALLGIKNSRGEKGLALVELESGDVLREYADDFAASLESAHLLDAERALSLTSDNRLIIWSSADGSLIRQVGIAPEPLARIEVDARGTIVFGQAFDDSEGSEGSAYVWSIAPALSEQMQELDVSAQEVRINHTGDALFIQDSGSARLLRIDDEEILFQSNGGSLARMNERGTRIAVSSAGEIQLIESANGEVEATWTLDVEQVRALHGAPQGGALLAESAAGELLLLRADRPAPQRLNSEGFGETRLVRFAEGSSAFISLHPEGALLWQGDQAEPVAAYALGLGPEYASPERFKIALSDDGENLYFFVMLEAGLASLTLVDREAESIQRQTFVDVAYGDLAANGKYLLLSRLDGSLQVLDVPSAAILNEVADAGGIAREIALLAERNWLYAAVGDTLLIWDLTANALVERVAHPDALARFSFSRDGRHALSEDASGVYRLIRVDTADELLASARARFTPRDLTCAERELYLALPFCD